MLEKFKNMTPQEEIKFWKRMFIFSEITFWILFGILVWVCFTIIDIVKNM